MDDLACVHAAAAEFASLPSADHLNFSPCVCTSMTMVLQPLHHRAQLIIRTSAMHAQIPSRPVLELTRKNQCLTVVDPTAA